MTTKEQNKLTMQKFLQFINTCDRKIAEDNKVMCRFTLTGTQSNPFFGVPATGKKVAVTAMNIYEFNEDGKIIREEGLPDIFSLLGQLGAFNK